jgi:mycothiol synthase
MIEPVALTEADAPQMAAFTRVACPYDLLTTGSIRRSIFADPDPQLVVAVYDGGLDAVACGVVRGDRGWLKFLAVHPASRRRDLGSALLERIESFCRDQGAETIEIGTSAPYYVVPGVDVRSMEMIMLLNASGYERHGDAYNLTVPLRDLPEPDLEVHRADESDLTAVRTWVDEAFPHWINELERAVRLGWCFVHDDLGFACYDVNRDAWFGPTATKPGHGGAGVGSATLLAALQAMRTHGYERVDIAWAVAHEFYAKAVGARIGRVFWGFRKKL